MLVVRFRESGGTPRLGIVDPDAPATVLELERHDVLAVLRGEHGVAGRTIEALDAETLELPRPYELLAPLVPPETWAAGVSGLVYAAARPERFRKAAAGRRTVGPGGTVGVRSDASWTVPEPELAVVLDEHGALLGATIGNDVTARDVEGANPLY